MSPYATTEILACHARPPLASGRGGERGGGGGGGEAGAEEEEDGQVTVVPVPGVCGKGKLIMTWVHESMSSNSSSRSSSSSRLISADMTSVESTALPADSAVLHCDMTQDRRYEALSY